MLILDPKGVLPDVVLGARRFDDPRRVAFAIKEAYRTATVDNFVAVLSAKVNGAEVNTQIIPDEGGTYVQVKSTNPDAVVGNEDHAIFSATLGLF